MKRIVVIILIICLLVSFSGCSKDKKTAQDPGSTQTDTEAAVNETADTETTSSETADNDTADAETADTETAANKTDDLQALSETYSLQMAEGNFEDVYKRFSLTVKLQMSEEALKQAWNTTVEGLGDYNSVYEITQEEAEGYQIVYVILEYENNGLKISYTYNKDGKIDGLWLNYSPIEEDAANTSAYEEIKISLGKDPYPVTGILTLPKNVEKPPVAILVPGSGTHDVNEVVGANKPFRDIAWGLAEQGIATIRYNERFLLYPELASGGYTIETDCLNDASDAVIYALSSDKIDTDHIIVIGHSLGAMMAPKIAADHPEVSGIILLAGSPRKLEEIVLDQVKEAAENTEGVTDAQAEQAISSTEDGIEAIKNLTESSSEVILGSPACYWYSLNQIPTSEIAAELTIPMFIAQGSADFQVFADKDYTAWQELLGEKENVSFKLYDGLNHLFMTSNGKTDITEYNTPGTVDKSVIEDMVQWIKSIGE